MFILNNNNKVNNNMKVISKNNDLQDIKLYLY